MKEAIANLANSAMKSLGLSVALLFIVFAAYSQTVDKNYARIDTLITKICKSVPGLKGIGTATPKDVQTLYNYACVAIAYGIYPNEFQKIKDTCMKAKAQDGAIDTTTALTPEQEKKILVPLSVAASNQTITDIRKKNGLGTSNEDLDKATLPQLEAALTDIKTQCPTVDAPAVHSTTGAVPVGKPAFGNKDIWPGISKSKFSMLWTILTGKKETQKLLAENKALDEEGKAKTAKEEVITKEDLAKTAVKEAQKTENAKIDAKIEEHKVSIENSKKGMEALESVGGGQTP